MQFKIQTTVNDRNKATHESVTFIERICLFEKKNFYTIIIKVSISMIAHNIL